MNNHLPKITREPIPLLLRLVKLASMALVLICASAQAVQTNVVGGVTFYVPGANPKPQVAFAWNPSPDSSVTSYNLYQGPSSGVYTNITPVGNVTNFTLALDQSTRGFTQYFVVTAVSSSSGLESVPSNEVSYTPRGLPSGTTLKPVSTVVAQSKSADASQWADIFDFGMTPDSTNQLYRLMVVANPTTQVIAPLVKMSPQIRRSVPELPPAPKSQ